MQLERTQLSLVLLDLLDPLVLHLPLQVLQAHRALLDLQVPRVLHLQSQDQQDPLVLWEPHPQ